MFGQGCPWKSSCAEYRKTNAHFKKSRCNSDNGCLQCSHRPMGYGDSDKARRDSNIKRNGSDANLGWVIIIAVIAFIVLGKIL